MDIVTGGASAAYGSDAVGGVINIILAKQLDGLRMSAQYGNTIDGAGDDYKIDLSYGFSFAENRAHVIVGGNHNDTSAIGPQDDNPAYRWNLLVNPSWSPTNGAPQILLARDVFSATTSTGGLIAGCGNALSPALPPSNNCGGLRNQTFESNGTHRAFILGDNFNGQQMSGGDVQATNTAHFINERPPLKRDNLFARFAYDLAPNIRFTADGYYARSEMDSDINPPTTGSSTATQLAISRDNAFLPADILAVMTGPANLTSIRLGRTNSDWGLAHNDLTIENSQGVVGLEGEFGNGWSWDVFYSYGENKLDIDYSNLPIISRLTASLDSILVGGQPVCRNLVANPGCVPVNVFGFGNSSQAARDYFMGAASQQTELSQQEGAATLRGEPFSIWAGPVSIATGAEWRRQSLTTTVDALSLSRAFLNSPTFANLSGKDKVYEGFLETVVPLAKDLPLVKSLEFNGAVRESHYESAGDLTSWKLGLNNYITEDLRLRVTRSQDIRAPNISELFRPATASVQTLIDPATNTPFSALVRGGGNPDLGAEEALTTAIGLVYQPSWARGLDLSLDFFKITISDSIEGRTAQDIVVRCFNGQASMCARLTRDNTGAITEVSSTLLNLTEQVQSGADFEAGYRFDLQDVAPSLTGQLASRLFVSYIHEQSRFDGVTRQDTAGAAGPAGSPHWRARLDERYQLGNLSLNARVRYVEGGDRLREFTIDSNYISSRVYLDLGAEYRTSLFGGNLSFYGNLINVLDRDPPDAPEDALHDTLGQVFNVGVRMTL